MKRLIVLSLSLCLSLIPAIACASSGMARLTLTTGEVLLLDEESDDWLPAAVNTPLEEGDRLWCPKGARAEIELRNGSVLRLGSGTSLDIVRLDTDAQQVYLGSGRLYVHTAQDDRDLQIDTEDATIEIGRKTRVHVDILGSGDTDTEVSVIKGSAYVEGNAGKTRVRSGQDLIFSDDSAEVAPLRPPDKWEKWNEERDRKLAKRRAESRYLPEELVIYEDELSANGEWVTIEEYGYAWRPTVSLSIDWSPYQQGRWVWRRGGYVWIASEPWGWAPHHYGRWHHTSRWGWCWIPPRRGDVYWSPGYVAWVDTPRDLAWVPLAPGEVYYGFGFFGSLSVNIATIDRRSAHRPIRDYRNTRVRNAVTVIDRTSFVTGRGKPRQGRPAGFDRYRGLTAPPEIRPAAREARMPVVRRVTPATRPPAEVQRHRPSTLKERFPRLEPERRKTPPLRLPRASEERPAAPLDRRQPPQQRVAPSPAPAPRATPAQPPQATPAPQRQPQAAPAPHRQRAPQTSPVQQKAPQAAPVPQKTAPDKEQRQPETGRQPDRPPVAVPPEPRVRSEEKPARGERRTEGRREAREQRQPEARPAPATQGPGVRQGQQPRRVWQVAPKEPEKEAPQTERSEQKPQQQERRNEDRGRRP